MESATILGFAGDGLTFVGGLVLGIDAIWRESEFRKKKDWVETIHEFKNVQLTRQGVRLLGESSVELVFIRLSVWRSIWGTAIVTLGFLALLGSRILEALGPPARCFGG
jgi:hypothetical protein